MAAAIKFLAAISFVLALSVSDAVGRQISDGLSMAERYEQWMAQFGRAYNDQAEKDRRFKIFSANVEYIDSFNAAGTHKYKLGVNQFADLTLEEMKDDAGGCAKPPTTTLTEATADFSHVNLDELPPELDWRTKGAVTPVKQQGTCGSCWAFSSVAAMEGIVQIKTGSLVPLSEQELVDCDTGSSFGCKNGTIAFDFIAQNGGLTAEYAYPYVGVQGSCKSDDYMVAASIRTYGYLRYNETALLQVVANQPASVLVDAYSDAFRYYTGGVFTGDCGTVVTHAVTVVGYGMADGDTKYWLIKNSWGTSWGEGGYMRLQRDAVPSYGLCGVAVYIMYPII